MTDLRRQRWAAASAVLTGVAIVISLFSSWAHAVSAVAHDQSADGKLEVQSEAKAGSPTAAGRRLPYKPVRREFWAQVDGLIKSGQASSIMSLAVGRNASGAEKDEWKLGLARGLIAAGQPIHGQYLLTQVATKSLGTRQGFEALRMIHEIAKAGPVDETDLEELAFELDTKVDEPESRSMIAYFRARALLRKGYSEWASQALTGIAATSTWNEELVYDRSMQALAAGNSADAYTHFENVAKSSAARAPTSQMAKLALARLIFERKDYRAAIATYVDIDLATRERARTLTELAWSYYYDRAYGKALGTIRALKSPYFHVLLSPETYVLEMLIYRELCHYRRVKSIAAEFIENYRSVFTNIENRKPLETIPQFVQMALQEGVLQRRAASIQKVRIERRELNAQTWSDGQLQRFLLQLGAKRERIADAEISRLLRTRVDGLANWFLDLREQVWFLEYEASMRTIQMNDDLAEQYEPPRASLTKPDILFWPVTDEAWRDELFDYEVLIGDTCRSPRGNGKRPKAGDE